MIDAREKKMRFSLGILACVLAMAPTISLAAEPHVCAKTAAVDALKLLKFHREADDRATVDEDGVKSLGKIKALRGKGRFDVLEVQGSIYKADYRMRMIYAVIGGDCVLMGQEVLEASDPF